MTVEVEDRQYSSDVEFRSESETRDDASASYTTPYIDTTRRSNFLTAKSVGLEDGGCSKVRAVTYPTVFFFLKYTYKSWVF